MPESVSPQAVLRKIAELRQSAAELGQIAGTLSDFAFKWAELNGGVPKDKVAMDRLLADYRVRFEPQPEVPDEQAMQAIEERYQAWAKDRRIETKTQADIQRFDDETRLLTRRMDELSGFTAPKDLAHRIGARLDELSRAAVAMGCDDATVAALKGAAALAPDIAEGRAGLDGPATWTEARRQANAAFQAEAIAGIPLNRAWEVALDRLEQAARSQAEACAEPKATPAEAVKADVKPAAVDYIDMDQAAALVNRSKKTLERSLANGKMPAADVEGGGGKKHEWDYAKLKPWLESTYDKILPPRPPHAAAR